LPAATPAYATSPKLPDAEAQTKTAGIAAGGFEFSDAKG
jgi:hypothetical protein